MNPSFLVLRRHARAGFTLVELLVVIAIIGVLVALLLPAVQAAREAARRSQCSNNVKQIGLALHNFHDTYKVFPPASDLVPAANPANSVDVRWCAGWATHILPYLEQGNMYEGLNIGGGTPGKFYTPSAAVSTLPNTVRLNNFTLKTYVCPASPLPARISPEDAPVNTLSIQAGNYVGIQGATTSAVTYNDPTGSGRCLETPANQAPNAINHGRVICANGVFAPGYRISMSNISDGTSNTIMLGEQSDWGFRPMSIGNTPNDDPRLDIRAARRAGIWANIGVSRANIIPQDGTPSSWEGGATVTVRHNIGTKRRTSFNDGIARYGFNTPIQATHPSGAMVLRCDGSVEFLSNSTDRTVLNKLCVRDDGT